MPRSMKDFINDSAFYGSNALFIELMLEDFRQGKPIADQWAQFFTSLGETASPISVDTEAVLPTSLSLNDRDLKTQLNVQELIQAYRTHGHLQADINPLGKPKVLEHLTLSFFGLHNTTSEQQFVSCNLSSKAIMTLQEIVDTLHHSYCGSIGFEYMHIADANQRQWLQQRIEASQSQRKNLSKTTKKDIFDRVVAAEGLEKFLGAKYPGAKRFSVEGGDSVIVLIDEIIEHLSSFGSKEIVIAMAHRGRLNTLINILGKSPQDLFDEFEGKKASEIGSGDVKYHQGFSSDIKTKSGQVHVALAFNPSHLEIVAPVALGSVAARAVKMNDINFQQVVPLIIHGDSAFAGQGVVYEVLNMAKTRGFSVGGSIHIVINNQIGFTTSLSQDTRSTQYCTDVAKMTDTPIFHVNADDPEAVWFVAQLAVEFKYAFSKDVIIDLVCYRRHGHNEADEPAVTQPSMYQTIRQHPTVARKYSQQLVDENILTSGESKDIISSYRKRLEDSQNVAPKVMPERDTNFTFDWSPYLKRENFDKEAQTKFPLPLLKKIGFQLCEIALSIKLHSRVEKIYRDRELMVSQEKLFDWGAAENLAYATLLAEGYNIRLTGQDSGRGTFFHRHCRVRCQNTEQEVVPLTNLDTNEGSFAIIDSLLSEEAVMAFEYGFAATDPRTLVLWEGQFGDFANGAQVVIDQFISSGEQKWSRFCGLTLLLPHGYEGQGPEHSSARLERYLQLCAQHNMDVCYPTTPAQIFHLLRRQMHRLFRRPLIIMTPKSLLRHKNAVSTLEEIADGSFQKLIVQQCQDKSQVKRVLLCTGKIYYELLDYQQEHLIEQTLLIRLEQLYPFPYDELAQVLKDFSNLKEVIWAQEEPRNQGVWHSQRHNMLKSLPENVSLSYAGRSDSAAPACGSAKLHKIEQEALIVQAFSSVGKLS